MPVTEINELSAQQSSRIALFDLFPWVVIHIFF
jgi:hypothetical protein